MIACCYDDKIALPRKRFRLYNQQSKPSRFDSEHNASWKLKCRPVDLPLPHHLLHPLQKLGLVASLATVGKLVTSVAHGRVIRPRPPKVFSSQILSITNCNVVRIKIGQRHCDIIIDCVEPSEKQWSKIVAIKSYTLRAHEFTRATPRIKCVFARSIHHLHCVPRPLVVGFGFRNDLGAQKSLTSPTQRRIRLPR